MGLDGIIHEETHLYISCSCYALLKLFKLDQENSV